jgi:hypothetical protein
MRKESEKIERIFISSWKLREFVELNFDGTRANDKQCKLQAKIDGGYFFERIDFYLSQ